LCDVGRVAVKHCFKLLSFFFTFIPLKTALNPNITIEIAVIR